MGACVTNCQTSHRANVKNNREVILKKWDFIDFFVPLPKAINDILLKTVISLFYCNCSKRISHWHIIDCVIFLFQTKKKKQSKWGKSDGEQGNNGSPWFTPFWYPWQLVLVYYKDGIHTEEDMMRKQNPSSGKLLLSRSRKSGSHTWVGFGVFLSRDIITRDTGI